VTSLLAEIEAVARAKSVAVTDQLIAVKFDDGRSISIPTKWYPRLVHATATERANCEIDSYGISWPDVEADFSIRGILLGQKSGEAPESLRFWLNHRRKGQKVTVQDYIKSRRSPRTVLAPGNIRSEKYQRWTKEDEGKTNGTRKRKQRKPL
jgi:hypothetical protein